VARNPALRESLIRRGLEYVELHGWDRTKQQYFDLVDNLSTQKFDNYDLKRGTTSVAEG
jgi:hypothetical protein